VKIKIPAPEGCEGGGKKRRLKEPALRGEEAATRTLLLLFLNGFLSLFLFSHDAVSEIFCAVALKILQLVKIISARKNPENPRENNFSVRCAEIFPR